MRYCKQCARQVGTKKRGIGFWVFVVVFWLPTVSVSILSTLVGVMIFLGPYATAAFPLVLLFLTVSMLWIFAPLIINRFFLAERCAICNIKIDGK